MHNFPLEDLFPGNFVRKFVSWNQMSQILIPLMRLHHFHLSLSKPEPNYKQDGAERQIRRIWRWQQFGSFVFHPFLFLLVRPCRIFSHNKNANLLTTLAPITTIRRVATANRSDSPPEVPLPSPSRAA